MSYASDIHLKTINFAISSNTAQLIFFIVSSVKRNRYVPMISLQTKLSFNHLSGSKFSMWKAKSSHRPSKNIIRLLTVFWYCCIIKKNLPNLPNIGNSMMKLSNGNTFRVSGPLCEEFAGHRWIPPHKGQWRGTLMISLICARIDRWVNTREAGDLRRRRSHYDVIVMMCLLMALYVSSICITMMS